MAIAFNSATSTNGNASSYTFSHTPSADNCILLVYVSYKNNTDVTTSVVFNGTETLTRLTGGIYGSTQVGSTWYLMNPTATTANVVVTLSNSEKAAIGAVTYTGVQEINTTNHSTTTGQNSSPTDTIITDFADSWIINSLAVRSRNSVITDDVNYTLRYTDNSTGNPANGTAFSRGYDRSVPTAGSYTATHSNSSTQAWVMTQAELRAAPDANFNNFGFIM